MSFSASSGNARRVNPGNRSGMIAIRTRGGRGRLSITPHQVLDVTVGTLVILNSQSLSQFMCLDSHWLYWGFEFDDEGGQELPVSQVLYVPQHASEGEQASRIVSSLRSGDCLGRSQASQLFQRLLNQWRIGAMPTAQAASWDDAGEPIARIVREMSNRLDGSLTVARMASMACLSESHFRRRFLRFTGETPKKHYDRLRLAWADEALRCGRMNVTEVAYALGFSSPFHFSRIFRQHFGCPPSHRMKQRFQQAGSNV